MEPSEDEAAGSRGMGELAGWGGIAASMSSPPSAPPVGPARVRVAVPGQAGDEASEDLPPELSDFATANDEDVNDGHGAPSDSGHDFIYDGCIKSQGAPDAFAAPVRGRCD